MLRKFRISVDGRAYDVVVEEIAEEGASPVHSGGAHVASPVALAASPVAVAKPVVRPVQRAAAPGAGASGAEVAPLAGVVVSIDVAVGQSVATGDRIAVIEAMKMKTDVFAKGAGAVAAIMVKQGEAVDAGGALLTLG